MTESEFEFPRYNLTGRKAVVTGASQGIGSWIALGLAEAGALRIYESTSEIQKLIIANSLLK